MPEPRASVAEIITGSGWCRVVTGQNCGEAGLRAEPQVSGARRSRVEECPAAVGSGATKSKDPKTKGTLLRVPLGLM
jgi:hypothetical protein